MNKKLFIVNYKLECTQYMSEEVNFELRTEYFFADDIDQVYTELYKMHNSDPYGYSEYCFNIDIKEAKIIGD